MPTKLSPIEELDVAIKAAARDAELSVPSREIAERLCEEASDLVAHFRDEWAVEKITGLIRWHRAKARRAADQQLAFEGVLGLMHLPRKIALKSGVKVPHQDATIGQWRQHRALLWKAGNPGLEEADMVIELMGKHTKKHPTITFAEVAAIEAEKAEKKAAK